MGDRISIAFKLEARTVMVDFIREITHKLPRIDANYYLGRDGADGDNGDNGHWVIDTRTGECVRNDDNWECINCDKGQRGFCYDSAKWGPPYCDSCRMKIEEKKRAKEKGV